MIDFSARWYSPNEGRFITEDTFGGWSDTPASLNGYSYAHNNPTTFTDPSGHCIMEDPDSRDCYFPPPGG
ncbi:RHS repeat-associated core domain-containing protein, partial [Bacillus suaedaesalsae]